MKRSTIILLAVLGALVVYGISLFNRVKTAGVAVDEQWAMVQSAYQARADKSKNLVEIIKGSAEFENTTLREVVEARAKATGITLSGDDLTPEKLAAFEQAQSQFTGALSRLMATIEQYPNLQTTGAFREFQAQYEGMENRIKTERDRFSSAVAAYNRLIVTFPGNLFAALFGFKEKTGFTAAPGSENAPDIKF
jgi:LemA protein